MKYTPVELPDNVNVSATHPLAELAWLIGGLLAIVATLYLALGFAADYAVERLPLTAENWLGGQFSDELGAEQDPALRQRLDNLLATLPADDPLRRYQFNIQRLGSDDVNALALPGGTIIVFSGLLDKINSENELSMVLGHELGHYARRDHLRGMGRGLAITFAALALFGQDSSATELISNLCLSFEARYSQQQEAAADAYGLRLLVARYGHAGGATDFFTRLAADAGSRLPYLLASHPHPAARIDALQQLIETQGYAVQTPQSLKDDLHLDNPTATAD